MKCIEGNNCDWQGLARVFCHSTKIKPGDRVLLRADGLEALPLITTIYKEALLLGAETVDYKITFALKLA